MVESIPERRPVERPTMDERESGPAPSGTPEMTVWRCKVCGYLCARKSPPETCPICKVSRDRFEPFEFA